MQNKDTTPAAAQASTQRSARDRVGLAVFGPDASAVVSTIVATEAAGYTDHLCRRMCADHLRAPGNVHCAHLSAPSAGPGAAGPNTR
jgi:hypothetical protein